jgi:hypothetical protein
MPHQLMLETSSMQSFQQEIFRITDAGHPAKKSFLYWQSISERQQQKLSIGYVKWI